MLFTSTGNILHISSILKKISRKKPRINVVFSLRCLFSKHLFLPLFYKSFALFHKSLPFVHMFALFSWILVDILPNLLYLGTSLSLFNWPIAQEWPLTSDPLIWQFASRLSIFSFRSEIQRWLIWRSWIADPKIKDRWSENHGSLTRKSRMADSKIMDHWSETEGSLIPKIMDRWSKNHGSLIQKSWTADTIINDRWSKNRGSLIDQFERAMSPALPFFSPNIHVLPPHSSPISSHPFHIISLFSISSLIPFPSHHAPLSSLSPVTPALYRIFSSSLSPQLCLPPSCLSFPISKVPLLSDPSPLSSLSSLIPLPSHPSLLSSLSPLISLPSLL